MNKLIEQAMEALDIQLTGKQSDQFQIYYETLVEWNKVMNLTAITNYDEVVIKHFADSLSIVKVCDMSQKMKLIDVGTGAGFPGIPIKIVYPHIEVVLLDSLNKRIKFLDEVIHKLEISEIYSIHGRAEDYARKADYRETFDLCVSRAVANLSVLAEYCIPFIRVGGIFIPYKSGNIEQEVDNSGKCVDILGSHVDKVLKFKLLNTETERSFVKIVKTKNTPNKYPRKAGVPEKNPIL